MTDRDATEEEPVEAAPLVGRLLAGKWRVERLLGEGGMSSVYEATHRNGRRVAIKVLSSEMAANARVRARFQREGYLANRVDHRGAVAVLDDDVSEEVVFLVMELLEGRTLEQLRQARGGRLSPEEVVWVGRELLEILEAAHRRGIFHRDVKPSNVFLTASGELKLLDFGIASLRAAPGSPSLTDGDVMPGTPGFMAPEQARGRYEHVGPPTDVWGVGALLFRLLTGRLVHEGETSSEELKIAVATRDAPSIATVGRGVPRSLAAVVDGALRREREERWQSASAMRDALVRAAERDGIQARAPLNDGALGQGGGPAEVRAEAERGPLRASHRRRAIAWITLALALAALLGATLHRARTRETASSSTAVPDVAPSTVARAPPSSPTPVVAPALAVPASAAATAAAPAPATTDKPAARRRTPERKSAPSPPKPNGSAGLPHELLKQRL